MRDILAGTVVDGRYEVSSRIGSGGMADVYVARDLQLGRNVAVKLLHGHFARDQEFVERFRREASAAAGLQHPNVVGIYDRGEWDGTYYIAMEYLEGRSLKQLIAEEGPLAPERAVDLTLQILKATRFAHKRGVIHRDIKSHNVIVDDEDRAKVTDFGIARAGASDMTQTGSIMGTAQYLSPEQAQGHPVGATSDLYSIGIVLYEMLTGRVPFQGDTAVTIALKQVNERPVPPRQHNPEISPQLEAAVMKALEKDPGARFQDAGAFAEALEAARDGLAAEPPGQSTAAFSPPAMEPVEYRPLTPTPPQSVYPSEPLPWKDEREPRERSRWPWVALLVVLLLAGGAFAAYALTRPEQVKVPNVVGQDSVTAITILKNRGFEVDTNTVTSKDSPRDTVTRQDPQPGSEADEGSTVSLVVSGGPGDAAIPDVENLSRAQARDRLEKAGFEIEYDKEISDAVAKNKVTRTDPPARSRAEKGSTVTVYVSTGREKVDVPDVRGKTRDDAEQILEGASLRVDVTEKESADQDPGIVLTQDPAPGSEAEKDSVVKLVVAKEPEQSDVPDVVGQSQDDALTALQDAGFKVGFKRQDVDTVDSDGIVLSQSPADGKAKRGSRVTITVGNFNPPLNPEG